MSPHRCSLLRLVSFCLAACGGGLLPIQGAPAEAITFFVMSDPQIHLEKWGTVGTEQTLQIANELPGKPFPLGGTVGEPRGVLVLGDLTDDVSDARHWQTYKRFFDPNGKALLRFRAFEGIGNHDLSTSSSTDFTRVQREVIERHQTRRGDETFHYDAQHYHYSWDWGPLHLVQLNIFPGNEPRRVYDHDAPWNNPRQSLDFLRDDLKKFVGDSGRPVILGWHYGLRGWGLEKWWTPTDLENLKEVIKPYNVVLILHGHEHAFAQYQWEGYPVFMCPSPQIDRDPKTPDVPSSPKGFLVVRLLDHDLQLAHHDASGWRETWSHAISFGSSTK
ncbi:MAG: metallophosphoesterase [Verrucomicrobiota bacterium]